MKFRHCLKHSCDFQIRAVALRPRQAIAGNETNLVVLLADNPPLTCRRWKAAPLAEEINMNACGAPGASDARIITPALTHELTSCWIELTRATMTPSPCSGV